jgi:large subunit ribosomal protein L6
MYSKEIEIPKGIKAEVNENIVKISGEKGQLERKFKGLHDVKIVLEGNKLKVSSESERRKIRALVGTIIAHVRNMIHGVTKGYTYTLKVIYSHFPVTIKVDDANRQVLVQNFLGEKTPRVAKIVGDTKVVAKGADITVTGIDVEDVAQTSANLEQATKIKMHDRKVFQDGVYLVTRERGKD